MEARGSRAALPWLIRGSSCDQMRAKSRPAFLKFEAYQCPRKNKKRGGVVNRQENPLAEQQGFVNTQGPFLAQQGFTTADMLWALGIWSVILSLSPVVVFYVLMVA